VDWVEDIAILVQKLGGDWAGVIGVSGGGPYAAACAARLPERFSFAALVASMAPLEAPEATKRMVGTHRRLLFLARRFPRITERIAGFCLRIFWHHGEEAIPRQVESRLPKSDQEALRAPGLRSTLNAASKESFRQGHLGPAWDGLLYARSWGFDLRDITIPVKIWHGDQDVIVPSSMGRFLAGAIPSCESRFFSDEGHFSVPLNHLREILSVFCRT
jgi:pimeloyl-ACP methyl ester carboxylesterase